MSESPSEWAIGEANRIILTAAKEDRGINETIVTIALALDAARKVPEGCVRQGVTDHKVLGTLPMTADGCVVMIDEYVWNIDQWSNHAKVIFRRDSGYGAVFHTQWRPIEVCFSTREAAEAARKDKA